MPTESSNFTNQFITQLELRYISYLEQFGLHFPNIADNSEELFLWKKLYSILARGHYRELITTQNIFIFAQKFSQLDIDAQKSYLDRLEKKFQDSNLSYENTINITTKLYNIQNGIESTRDKLPEAVKIIYDYIIYSRLSGEEVDENLINEAIHELSPEGQAELAAANIYQTIEKTKRKPLNAGRIDGQTQYNQVFTKEQLAKVLEEDGNVQANIGNSPNKSTPSTQNLSETKVVTPGIRTLPKKQPTRPVYSQQNLVSRPRPQPTQNYPQQQPIRRSPIPRTVMNSGSTAPRVAMSINPQNRPLQTTNRPLRTQPPTSNQNSKFSKTVHGLDDLLK